MPAFLKALVLITVAEMADKTQLLILAFAARLPVKYVLGGMLVGALATQALAVALGGLALVLLPAAWVKLVAGLSFLGFGLWTLRSERPSAGEEKRLRHPLLTVAASFVLAEMGDKTQLATAVLAAEAAALVPVWLGSSLGMIVANTLAVGGGVVIGQQLPERAARIWAAILFGVFGVLLLWEGLAPQR